MNRIDENYVQRDSMVQNCTCCIKDMSELSVDEKTFISQNAKYFQSLDWADLNHKLGKKSGIIIFHDGNEIKNTWLFFRMELNVLGFHYREIRLETEPVFYNHADSMLIELIQYCKENRYDNILFQTNMSNWTIDLKKMSIHFSNIADFGTCIIDLNEENSQICKKVHKKHRNIIRKAVKMNYHVIEDKQNEKITDFYNLINETYSRSGQFGYSMEYLQTILSSQYNRLFLCYSGENELTAAAVIVGDKKQAYYLHGGSITSSNGASNLLQWHIIKQLKTEGCHKYDFGGVSYNPVKGSKPYGIRMFKERFGGEFIHVYRGQIIINKTKTDIMALVRKIYNGSRILKKIFHINT